MYILLFFRYFHDGLQTIEHFGTYIDDLVNKLTHIRQYQFEEKRDLEDVRNVLKTSPGFNKMVSWNISFDIQIQKFVCLQKMGNYSIFLKQFDNYSHEAYMYNTTLLRTKDYIGRYTLSKSKDFSTISPDIEEVFKTFMLLLSCFLFGFLFVNTRSYLV